MTLLPDAYDFAASFFEDLGGMSSCTATYMAHNILMNPEGQAYLGDLGAASSYDIATDNGKRERIDIRGFGYLVDDLLAHVEPTGNAKTEQLSNVRDACLGSGGTAIHRFSAVQRALQDI